MGEDEGHEQAIDAAELARLRAELDEATAKLADRHVRARSLASGILVVLTALSVVLATLGVWLHSTLLDTDRFMETVTPVFSEEAVTDALGLYVTEQTFEALGLSDRVENTLSGLDDILEAQLLGLIDLDPRIERRLAAIERPRFADLADPLVAAAQNSVEEAVQDYLASDEFQRTFQTVAERAHAASVALLRGEYERLPNVVVDERSARIDLTPAVVGVIQRAVAGGVGFVGFEPPPAFVAPVENPDEARAWLSDVLRFDPPDEFAQVTVMSAEQLEELQGVMRWFDRLVYLLVGLVVLLSVSAIWISHRRLRTVTQLGVGAVLASILAWLVLQRLEQVVIEAFGDSRGREAARVTIGRTVSSLESLGVIVMAVSLLVAVISFAFSRDWHRKTAALIVTRQGSPGMDRAVVEHFDALRIGGAGLALVVLWVTGIGLGSVLVVGLLLSGYLLVLAALRSHALSVIDQRTVERL
jgi:hypothetical protein